MAIQKLEEELGAQLFERAKAEITVTPVGERIVEQAQKVLEEAARIRDIAQAGRNQLVGVFRLGAIHTVAPYLFPDLIPALNERAPEMPLEIEENVTEYLESALKSGRIDAAIIALPFQPPGVVADFLYEEPFQVVVPRRHPWAKRKSIAPAELTGEHTILLNVGHCFRDQVLDSCPELNRGAAAVTRTNSLETIRNMVASGLGVSVLAARRADPQVSQPDGGAGAVYQAGAVAPHRAGLSQEFPATGGDRGDPRRGRCVSWREGQGLRPVCDAGDACCNGAGYRVIRRGRQFPIP